MGAAQVWDRLIFGLLKMTNHGKDGSNLYLQWNHLYAPLITHPNFVNHHTFIYTFWLILLQIGCFPRANKHTNKFFCFFVRQRFSILVNLIVNRQPIVVKIQYNAKTFIRSKEKQ